MKSFRTLRNLSFVIILLAIIASSAGLFWEDGGTAFYMESIHGESVKMFGNGLYAHETFFKAPILKGTDAVTLFLVVPAFYITVVLNRRTSLKFRILHLSILSYLLYYSASLAFGASYNKLMLVYILLFSSCLFAFVLGIAGIDGQRVLDKVLFRFPHRAVSIFMVLAGLSVFVWLIEIVGTITSGTLPATLGIYTTEPTFVLDLGVIAPTAFASAYLVIERRPLGYILAPVLLTLNALIGITVVSQTLFQQHYGVVISVGQFVAFVGVFVAMSLVAIILDLLALNNVGH